MADINSLSFGCGEILLATKLNIMADAIRSLITLVGTIGDQVGSYIPLSGSEDITGVLAPDTNEGYDLGKSTKRWGTVWASTGGFKTIDFYNLQTPFGKLGELYVGKDTSNNNEAILQFKHGNDNEEIVATRDWVNSLLNFTKINIGSTGSISEELYNDESNYIKIESSSDNPIVIAGYDENSVPTGIKFGDASTGDVLTVHNGKIYINDDIFSGDNGVSVLNDLSDVDASAARTGLFLMYNGEVWVNSPLPESLIIHPDDVSVNQEYYLMYTSTDGRPSGGRYSWVERPPGAKKLNELNDVEINDNKLELGQVLVYSQVTDEEHNTCNSWVNKTVSGVLTYDQDDHDKYLKVNSDGDGTEWVSASPGVGATSLSGLSDVDTITNNPTTGLVLSFDGTNWKNTDLLANLPPTTDRSAGDYLVLKDDNGTLKADWTNVTSNIADIDGTVNVANTYDKTYKLKTSGGTTTGTGVRINGLSPNVISKDTSLEFPSGFNVLGTDASLLFKNILATNKISLLNTNFTNNGNTGFGKKALLEYTDNNINIKTFYNNQQELAGVAKLYLNGTEIGTGGSGLTGIKYQTTGNATTITPSSGYVTLKAGNNVSFNNSSTGILEISASVTNGGGLTSGSWASYFDEKTKGITPASGLYLKWGSDGNLTQDSGSYTLLPATNSALGGMQVVVTNYNVDYKKSSNNYKLQMDGDTNIPFVHVPTEVSTSDITKFGNIVASSISSGGIFNIKQKSNGQHVFYIVKNVTVMNSLASSFYFFLKGTITVSSYTITNPICYYNHSTKEVKSVYSGATVDTPNTLYFDTSADNLTYRGVREDHGINYSGTVSNSAASLLNYLFNVSNITATGGISYDEDWDSLSIKYYADLSTI